MYNADFTYFLVVLFNFTVEHENNSCRKLSIILQLTIKFTVYTLF